MFYRTSTAVTGAFLLERELGTGDLGLEHKAEALATTLRRAFEPAAEPPPRAFGEAARELADVYEQWAVERPRRCPEKAPEGRDQRHTPSR